MKRKHHNLKKRKWIKLLIVLALVIFFASALIKDMYKKSILNKSAEYLKKGQESYLNRDYPAATANFKMSISLNPSYEAYYGLAASYDALGKKFLAIEYYSKSLSLNRDNADTHRFLGNLYYKTLEYELAISQFNKAAELNPKDFLAMNGAALSYRKLGNYKKSLKYYNKSLSVRYNEPAIEGMGIAYSFLGDYDKAIEYLSQTYEKDAYSTYGLFKLAFAYIRKGNYDKAILLAENEIKKNPNEKQNYLLHDALGSAYMLKGEYGRSISHYLMSLGGVHSASDDAQTIKYQIGVVYILNNSNQEAIDYLQQYLAAKPSVSASKLLAVAYNLSGNAEKAEEFEKMSQGLRQSYITTALVGMIYLNHNEDSMAINEFSNSIRLNAYYYLPYEGMAKAYFNLGDYAKAKGFAEKSLELNPSNEESRKILQSINNITIK